LTPLIPLTGQLFGLAAKPRVIDRKELLNLRNRLLTALPGFPWHSSVNSPENLAVHLTCGRGTTFA